MDTDRGTSDDLVLALEAVLRTEQLAEVRSIIDYRLTFLPAPARWEVTLAVNELVANAILHGGRCTGLRVYDLDPVIRIEVDDPSPASPTTEPDPERGLSIVATLAAEWGHHRLATTTSRNEPQPPSDGKTMWCELHLDRSGR
jgi:anti-sigma regulatory factor (Ser/Thr protein kinase)